MVNFLKHKGRYVETTLKSQEKAYICFFHKDQITARGSPTVLEILTGVSERHYLLMDSYYPFWDNLMRSIKFLVWSPKVLQSFILPLLQQGFKPFCFFPSGHYSPSLVKLTLCLVTGTNHWSKMLQFGSQAENFWHLIENFTQKSDTVYLIHVTPTFFQWIHWTALYFPVNIRNLG